MEQSREKDVCKLIMNRMKGIKVYIVVSFMVCMALQLVELIPPIMMQKVVDIYIPNRQTQLALLSILIFIGIPMLATLGNTLYQYFLNVIGRRYGQKMTMWGICNLLGQPLTYFEQHNSSELVSYCKSEAMKYVIFLLFDIPQIVAKICSGMITLLLIARVNLWLALITILYIPFACIPSNCMAKKVEKYIMQVVQNNAKVSQVMNDTFRGIRFVKAMCLEKIQIKKIQDINESTIRIWGITSALDNLNGAWADGLMSNLFTGVIFGLSAFFIINGDMTLGTMVIVLNYLPRIFAVVSAANNVNFDYKKQVAEFAPLFEVITMESMEDSEEPALQCFDKSSWQKICFSEVHFTYDHKKGEVLKGLTFSVPKGSWIGVIGQSGSGKSTIFDLLMGFIRADSGSITIGGKSINEFSRKELRKNVTLVLQTPFLFPGTVRENLEFVRSDITDAEMLDALEYVGLKKRIIDTEAGLDTQVGENGVQLSGGEMQRLSLAQGLLRKSQILLLDEVTASVDSAMQHEIQNLLYRLVKEEGITIISISHRMEFLSKADQVLFLKEGQIVHQGSYQEVINWYSHQSEESKLALKKD